MAILPQVCQHKEDGIRQRRNYDISDGVHREEIEIGVCRGCLNLVGRRAGDKDWRVLLMARPKLPDDAPDGQKAGEAKKVEKVEAAEQTAPSGAEGSQAQKVSKNADAGAGMGGGDVKGTA